MEACDHILEMSHTYTRDAVAKPYFLMWLLQAEVHMKLEQGKLEEAKGAVRAFTELLRAKLSVGDRSAKALFATIRLTEASSAGRYKMTRVARDVGRPIPLELTPDDLQPIWSLINSVRAEEWVDTGGMKNCLHMIERATGR